MSLIPKIVIGEKYVFRHNTIEAVCPHCGYILGSKREPYEQIVTVTGNANGMCCSECFGLLPSEGWYAVDAKTRIGTTLCVPYTQLEEIQEEEK
ncbi:hypothetical protein LCGC14_1986820 [marine sediment metagenome]|uniref:Uncharacterized protein n=1 Tax=marine sediment metagenome TaxID=412755 RepID=A0A0F9F7G9_9ZZZZ